ncbi:MAG: hypothetical protein HYS64_05605 [Rhodospirillales bacterium]|nr:hypothetical protein [Rhodospirillales bacterium]
MALPIAVGALIPVAVAALLALDPLEMNLVPALSRSPAMASLRAEIRTWPLIAPLFAGERDGAARRDDAGTRP